MASILEALSQGLRGAGAAMSPNVYNTQTQELENERQRSQRNKELVLGLLANAAENGAIAPEVFQQKAQELGLGNVPIGPSLQAQEAMRVQQLRASRAPAMERIFQRTPQVPTEMPFTQDSIQASLAMGGGPTREADAILQESGIREAPHATAARPDPRLDPAAWREYAQEREVSGDMEEAKRAYEMAERLSNQIAPQLKEVGGNLYQIQPLTDSGDVSGFSATPVQGITPAQKDPWSGITPSQYTQESLAAYQQSIDQGAPNRALLAVNPRQTAEAGAAKIVNQVGSTAFEELAKAGAKNIAKQQEEAESAASTINVVHNARRELDKGIFTGFGANVALGVGRMLSQAGFKAAEDPVANTQAYAAYTGNLVGQIIKQFGAGTGLSDADREYAQKIAGGDIKLDEKALRRLLDLNEKGLRIIVQRYKKKAKQIDENPTMKEVPFRFDIEEPGPYVPPQSTADELKKRYGLE